MKMYKYIPFFRLIRQYHSHYRRMQKRNSTPMTTLVNAVVPVVICAGGIWLLTMAMFVMTGVILI